MFGNLVNNKQLQKLIEEKHLEISEFNPNNMSLAHYTFYAGSVKTRTNNGAWVISHDFEKDSNAFMVPPNGYVIVAVKERIKLLNDHIVGEFCPTSNLIESGFGLVAGKIDKRYGTTGGELGQLQETVVFGLKNYLNEPNQIKKFMRLAHMALFDLRGVAAEKIQLTKEEIDQRISRRLRAMDDGPNYE